MRARVVLLAADGMSDKDIARELDTDRRVAARWRVRFLTAGPGRFVARSHAPGAPAHGARSKQRARGGARHARGAPRRSDSLKHSLYKTFFEGLVYTIYTKKLVFMRVGGVSQGRLIK